MLPLPNSRRLQCTLRVANSWLCGNAAISANANTPFSFMCIINHFCGSFSFSRFPHFSGCHQILNFTLTVVSWVFLAFHLANRSCSKKKKSCAGWRHVSYFSTTFVRSPARQQALRIEVREACLPYTATQLLDNWQWYFFGLNAIFWLFHSLKMTVEWLLNETGKGVTGGAFTTNAQKKSHTRCGVWCVWSVQVQNIDTR